MRRQFFVRWFVCDRCAKGEEGIGLSALFSLARESVCVGIVLFNHFIPGIHVFREKSDWM